MELKALKASRIADKDTLKAQLSLFFILFRTRFKLNSTKVKSRRKNKKNQWGNKVLHFLFFKSSGITDKLMQAKSVVYKR